MCFCYLYFYCFHLGFSFFGDFLHFLMFFFVTFIFYKDCLSAQKTFLCVILIFFNKMMIFFHESINIKFSKQIIMVMVQVIVEWSKTCCNLKSKKWVFIQQHQVSISRLSFELLVAMVPIVKSLLSKFL